MINGMDTKTVIDISKKVLLEMIEGLIEELRPTMSLDELQRVYMKRVDEIILREEKEHNTKYIGGEFSLNYVDANNYDSAYRLFFQNEEKKIYEISARSKPLNISFLSKSVIQELQHVKSIKFEIPEPSVEARYKFIRKIANSTSKL